MVFCDEKSVHRPETIKTTFVFTFPGSASKPDNVLELPITIPFDESAEEYSFRVLKAFDLPCFLHKDLQPALEKFLKEETLKYHDDISNKKIEEAKSPSFDIDSVIKNWEKVFKNETAEYCEPVGASDEELFSTVYHKLVHSPALEMMLQAEHSYAGTSITAAQKRSQKLQNLSGRQSEEMAEAIEKLNEKEINDLAGKHFEEHNLLAGRLNSELGALQDSQRKEYRAWLMTMLEQQAVFPSPLCSPLPADTTSGFFNLPTDEDIWPAMEESFTIHLGSQLKQMHNVRILSANVLDFCRIKSSDTSPSVDPQRVETALSLYSNNLSALVLLSDVGSVGGFTGLAKDFGQVCQETTEFHFGSLDDQLDIVKSEVKQAVAWRASKVTSSSDAQTKRIANSKNLQPGDTYITKHSNLSQVHVVFHMLVDDSVKSNDMNSRHSVILGLRNVLKTAASHDVTTLTLPLLLTHDMTEDMTVAWCSKRAELVFKCVKGFMIEAAGTGGAELRNLQFLVPSGISVEVFSTLASMLTTIFRVSNPKILEKASS